MGNASTAVESQSRGAFAKLTGIFFQPRATFEAIAIKPDWVVALIVLIVLSLIVVTAIDTRIGFQEVAIKQMEERGMSQEQIDQATSGPASGIMTVTWYLGATIGLVIILLLISAIFLLGFYLIGADITYKKTLSVVTHSWFAYSLITSMLAVLILFITAEPSELDVQNLVASNLGILVDRTASPLLFSLLSSIDLFSFYLLFLLSLGMAVVSRKPVSTGAAIVIVVWVLYVAAKVGITSFFASGTPAS